jgi:hypothetical protein
LLGNDHADVKFFFDLRVPFASVAAEDNYMLTKAQKHSTLWHHLAEVVQLAPVRLAAVAGLLVPSLGELSEPSVLADGGKRVSAKIDGREFRFSRCADSLVVHCLDGGNLFCWGHISNEATLSDIRHVFAPLLG